MLQSRLTSRFRLLAAAAFFLGWLSLPAVAATIVTRDGKLIVAERLFFTQTSVVGVSADHTLSVVPNADVVTVDGMTLAEARHFEQTGERPTPVPSPNVSPTPTTVSLNLSETPGTERRYQFSQIRRSTVKRANGNNRTTVEASKGEVIETLVGRQADGQLLQREQIITQAGYQGPHSELLNVIDTRAGDWRLSAQQWVPKSRKAKLSQPIPITPAPLLWPRELYMGQSWVNAPFKRLGIMQTGQMSVVGYESISVPAGQYPAAFKVRGTIHLFAGAHALRKGRLLTHHGTLQVTTWLVPGIGPVREESDLALEQEVVVGQKPLQRIPLHIQEHSERLLTTYTTKT